MWWIFLVYVFSLYGCVALFAIKDVSLSFTSVFVLFMPVINTIVLLLYIPYRDLWFDIKRTFKELGQ